MATMTGDSASRGQDAVLSGSRTDGGQAPRCLDHLPLLSQELSRMAGAEAEQLGLGPAVCYVAPQSVCLIIPFSMKHWKFVICALLEIREVKAQRPFLNVEITRI